MAADTVPAAVPDPTDPPAAAPINQAPQGAITSLFAAVDPARTVPDFDLAPNAAAVDGATQVTSGNGSSDAYHGDEADHDSGNSGGGKSIQKQGIWRAWLLAGATRWGKGGGAVNKRLDLAKVKAQRRQVKENRQVSINRSGGLLGNRSGGSGGSGSAGSAGGVGKSGGGKSLNSKNSGGGAPKGPKNSNGSAHHGSAGHSGNGGKSGGRSGGSGGSGSGGGSGRGPGGTDGASPKPHKRLGGHGDHSPKQPRQPKSGKAGSTGGDQAKSAGGGKSGSSIWPGGKSSTAGSGKDGKSGSAQASGKAGGAGKDAASGSTTGTGTANGEKPGTTKGDTDGKKTSHETKGKDGAAGMHGKDGRPNGPKNSSGTRTGAGADSGKGSKTDSRTPLEKSRETGHGDGSKARRIVDHVRAYTDGVKDGWGDERDKNAKEHHRLDKAHTKHKAKLQGTTQGQTAQIEDDNEPMEDPFMSQATPIQAQGIDAKKLTLGEDCLKPSVTRGELRRFKDYEGRLESRIDALARIADATKQLAAQAREQADDCQKLAEEAKGVKGGEKLIGQLQQLADKAKAQADEANEVHKRAARAHDFAKAVLSNIQTRYAPLYQAVVDSDEVKPAELKFYADRGVTPTNTALAA